MSTALRNLMIVTAAYVAAQMMSDIASLRIVEVFGFAVDAGTLVYPFTFTIRDLIHKIAGAGAARVVIVSAAAINLLMALVFWVTAALPADLATGPQLEFGLVLAPVWRIVFASIAAEVTSELIDTEAYQRWVDRFGSSRQWGRVLASNGVSVPIDSAVFVTVAFVGVLPSIVIWEIFWVNVVFKGLVSVVSIPAIYWVRPASFDPDREGSPT